MTLRASVKRFGFITPFIENASTGLLSEGHGRRGVLQKMRAEGKPAPRFVLVQGDRWLVPVVRGLSFENADEAEAWLVASNRIGELGGWGDKIAEALQRIRAKGALEGVGYTVREIDRIVSKAQGGATVEPPPAARPKSSRVQPGEVWALGRHALACGDSRDPELWARLLAGRIAELLIADPPYGMGKVARGVHNDDLRKRRLDEFQFAWWRAASPQLHAAASAFVWGKPEDLFRWWLQLAASGEFTFRNEIVWTKKGGQGINDPTKREFAALSERCLFFALGGQSLGNLSADQFWEGWESLRAYLASEAEAAGFDDKRTKEITKTGMHSHWFGRSQWCLPSARNYRLLCEASGGKFFARPYAELKAEHRSKLRQWNEWRDAGRAFFDNAHEKMTDVWDFPSVKGEDRKGHATVKPVLMMARKLKSALRPGGIVIDPFCGTGPVLLAAEQTDRICVCAEIDPIWCEATIQRWEALTGQKATRISK